MARRAMEKATGGSGWRQAAAAGLLALLCAAAGAAQLSPGPLSRAHQSLGGITQCTTCHALNIGSAELKCAACHTEIAQRVQQRRGLHATLVRSPADTQECARCHSEHNGAEFELIRWDAPLERFDHRQAGYALEGGHAGVPCRQCHTPAQIRAEERSQIKVRDLNRTWLGLGKDCAGCHEDPHAGRLGADCAQCHGFSDWKTASRFDHSRTRFPLTGLHLRVACEQCHTPAAPGGAARLTGLAFGSCSDCHRDPHRGSFAEPCASCHSTSGWPVARMPASFDHSQTDFPLLGKHTAVGCSDCHMGGDFRRPLAHGQCMDCHRPDPHGGQFQQRTGGAECASCHSVDGFRPSTFGVAEHAASGYPLEGKHADAACEQCHVPAGAATKFKIPFGTCTDCHADQHGGQFAAAPHQNRCEDCHDLHGFQPSRFSLAQHQATDFVLKGAHTAVPCLECHRPASIGGVSTARFHFTDQTCTGCHADPHEGRFRAEMSRVRADGTPAGCEACHTTETWRNPAGFDHSGTDFPLTGAHRSVTCSQCHLAGAARQSAFGSAPRECEGCHRDPHGRQFAGATGQTVCANCHATGRWAPSNFDHNRDASFRLEGAHQNVPCAGCHETWREVDGQPVLFYKPTPTACADCHTDRELQAEN